jgi:competence protein ComEC
VETQVLWPAADREPTKNANNDSVVLRLGYGRRHVLLPGDAETTVERRLLKAGVALQSDVLKVPHHGSNDATSLPFLEAVAPSFGILSVGPYNAYGHPRPETLANLRQAGARITRTDRDGATSVRTDGNRIEVGTFRETLRDWPPFPPVSSGGSGGGKR